MGFKVEFHGNAFQIIQSSFTSLYYFSNHPEWMKFKGSNVSYRLEHALIRFWSFYNSIYLCNTKGYYISSFLLEFSQLHIEISKVLFCVLGKLSGMPRITLLESDRARIQTLVSWFRAHCSVDCLVPRIMSCLIVYALSNVLFEFSSIHWGNFNTVRLQIATTHNRTSVNKNQHEVFLME